MSYVSGFMLGASLAKYLRQYMSGGGTAPTSFFAASRGERGKRPRGRLPRTGALLLPFSCVHASARGGAGGGGQASARASAAHG